MRISNEDLRAFCIQNDLFNTGSNDQYEKLFRLNDRGACYYELSLVIWLCSDTDKSAQEISMMLEKMERVPHGI